MVTKRTKLKRFPKRGHYDRATIDAILDEAILCHIGIAVEGQPYVIPSLHARVGDVLYLHGSAASRTLRRLSEGVPCRWADTKPPTRQELKATSLLALSLDEASAKIRSGPPGNHEEDAVAWAGTWTGVLPIRQVVGAPIPAPDIAAGVEVPAALARYGERFAR